MARQLTRLPDVGPPKGPDYRWQKLPTRPRTETAPSSKTPKSGSTTCRRTKSAHTPGVTPGRKTPNTSSVTPASSMNSCRFIPKRGNEEYSSYLLLSQGKTGTKSSQTNKDDSDDDNESDSETGRENCENDVYRNSLLKASCQGKVLKGVLSFRNITTPGALPSYVTPSGGVACEHSITQTPKRKVDTSVEKVLDAPEIIDDYYLNVLDWSVNNIVAIALGINVYLWNGETGSVEQVQDVGGGACITSLSWSQNGRFLAIGLDNGGIQLYNADSCKKMRTMRGHTDRVGSLNWSGHILASGSRNGEVHLHDVRRQDHLVGRLVYHTMEVCGLQWSPDGFLASGSNDNNVAIWKPMESDLPLFILKEHKAAVKALAWCPWKPHILATGGGTNDKTIRFWDTKTGECLRITPTKSPVSSLAWCKEYNELISSHGHPKNQMIIWSVPTMSKVAELKGHTGRIIHMAMSPKRTRVISASADETLRIWHCFKKSREPVHVDEDSMSLLLSGIL